MDSIISKYSRFSIAPTSMGIIEIRSSYGIMESNYRGNLTEGNEKVMEISSYRTSNCRESIVHFSCSNPLAIFFSFRSRTPSDGDSHDTIIVIDNETRQKRAYNKKLVHDWKHEDTLKLIELWKGEESTYNKQCVAYRDKSERARAYERIRDALDEGGISVSTDEIFSKMHSLRVYYCAKNIQAEEARQKFGGEDEDHVRWPYYAKLSFLKENMNPRSSTTTCSNPSLSYKNTRYETTTAATPTTTSTTEDATIAVAHHFKPTRPKRSRVTMVPIANNIPTPVPMSTTPTILYDADSPQDAESADELFCKMLALQLKELPRQTRECVKHEISGLMLQARYPEYATRRPNL